MEPRTVEDRWAWWDHLTPQTKETNNFQKETKTKEKLSGNESDNYGLKTEGYLDKHWTSSQRGPVRMNWFVASTDTVMAEEVRAVETEHILVTLTWLCLRLGWERKKKPHWNMVILGKEQRWQQRNQVEVTMLTTIYLHRCWDCCNLVLHYCECEVSPLHPQVLFYREHDVPPPTSF